MSGMQVFGQMVTDVTLHRAGMTQHIAQADYEQWQEAYIFLALKGQRYGQSFCNEFGITDNHLYYNTGGVDWCDNYIRKTYLA